MSQVEPARQVRKEVLKGAQRIDLDAEAFARFVAALDAPVEEMPVLRRYARRRSPIPAR
jgi:uncharacterized protein (DUF1778 family)